MTHSQGALAATFTVLVLTTPACTVGEGGPDDDLDSEEIVDIDGNVVGTIAPDGEELYGGGDGDDTDLEAQSDGARYIWLDHSRLNSCPAPRAGLLVPFETYGYFCDAVVANSGCWYESGRYHRARKWRCWRSI